MIIKNLKRLIADEGKLLTNGKIEASVVDVPEERVDEWSEIDKPVEEDEEVE